jgi:hypothetical protein
MKKLFRARPLVLAPLLALFGACSDAPTGARPCTLPATAVPQSVVAGMTAAHVRTGLEDAVTRLVPAVATAADRVALERALADVGTSLTTIDDAQACVALRDARMLLDRAPARVDTIVDREVLHFVLDIATTFLASRGQASGA